jgi:hypothetical protein
MARAYSVGDLVPFAIQIYDSTNTLANASTVTITITQPDGTTAGPFTVTASTTGSYAYTFTATQSGRHLGQWSASGTNAGGEPQAFYVQPVAPLLTVGEVKAHLSIQTTNDDDELAAFIAASIPILEGLCGPISPRVITGESHDGGQIHLFTDFAPIISISSLTEMIGYTQFTLTSQNIGGATDNYGYTVDDAREGRITRRGVGSIALPFGFGTHSGTNSIRGSVLISYTAGRSNPSENVRMAAKELIRYMWRQVHGNPQSFTDGYVSAAASTGVSQAMIERLRLILGPEAQRPIGMY